MKVLFVDDEPQVLHGIQRALYRLSDQWIIATAGSGKEALAELAREPYDAIVTDMRMPEMDGAALLQEVEKRYPRMVRIVLSGYTELEATLRTVPVAHQFLTKPCSPEVIEEVVERAFSLQALLADEAVRDVVGRIETLPSVPHIYSELTKALADPASDVDTVADILAQDPAMSAKVLQLVNSAFFFRGTQCSDVRHAVMRLGFTMIKNLALSVEVFRTPVSLSTAPGFSIEALQQHSLRTASLAGQLLPDKRQSEDAFMAGMLHDIGMLAMPDTLLLCPGVLDEQQTRLMRRHPLLSVQMMEGMEFLEQEIPAVRYHHERYDGQGYPEGLAGAAIPLTARILAVADSFVAMTSPRTFRAAKTCQEAVAELELAAGTQFDPNVVDAFIAMARRLGDELMVISDAAAMEAHEAARAHAAAAEADADPNKHRRKHAPPLRMPSESEIAEPTSD